MDTKKYTIKKSIDKVKNWKKYLFLLQPLHSFYLHYLYNNMKRLKNTAYMSNQAVYYANLTKSFGKVSDCIGCGLCEENCPQNLTIRKLLEEVASAME